ncbi:hypothetical protein Tco_0760971 [Tanacetum coccineum]
MAKATSSYGIRRYLIKLDSSLAFKELISRMCLPKLKFVKIKLVSSYSLSPGPPSQENVPQVAEIVTMSNELELLYSPMFSELLNGNYPVVSKSSAVHAADNPDNR